MHDLNFFCCNSILPILSKLLQNTLCLLFFHLFQVAEKVESQMFYSQEFKKEKDVELKPNKDIADQESNTANDAELMPSNNVVNVEEVNLANDEGLKPENDAINDNLAKDEQLSKPKSAEFITLASVEEVKFVNDIEEMKLKLNVLESKLNEVSLSLLSLPPPPPPPQKCVYAMCTLTEIINLSHLFKL